MVEMESSAARAIAERMKLIEPGSTRFDVLEVARRFKTSWVDLGGKLYQVRQKKLYKQWGYSNFEEYCRQEIRIKSQTAAKLTASYAFLKVEDPSILKRDGVVKPVPDVQVVDMLRRVREQAEIPEKQFSDLKEMACSELAPSVVRKKLRQHLPADKPLPLGKAIRQLMLQASRLAEALASAKGVPHAIVRRASDLVEELRRLEE